MTLQYECVSLAPAPAFTVPTPRVVVAASDGLGAATCTERGAQFALDGVPTPFDPEQCFITITERGERSITGTLTARLLGQDAPHDVTMTFEHNRNRVRPAAGLHLGNDVCVTNTVAHTVRTEGSETFDDFVTGPLTCQRGEPLQPLTLVRRRANAASTLVQDAGCGLGRFNLVHEGGSTIDGGCGPVFLPAESEETLRVVANQLNVCSAAGCVERPIAFLSFGFGDAAAAVP